MASEVDAVKHYESARKDMYSAIEASNPHSALQLYQEASRQFTLFLQEASKSYGVYIDLVQKTTNPFQETTVSSNITIDNIVYLRVPILTEWNDALCCQEDKAHKMHESCDEKIRKLLGPSPCPI